MCKEDYTSFTAHAHTSSQTLAHQIETPVLFPSLSGNWILQLGLQGAARERRSMKCPWYVPIIPRFSSVSHSRLRRSLLSDARRPPTGISGLSTGPLLPSESQGQSLRALFPTQLLTCLFQDDPKLWYGIGILYDRYGSLDHAEEAFSSVLRMDKGMSPLFRNIDNIYWY